jgi:hypothetical protein
VPLFIWCLTNIQMNVSFEHSKQRNGVSKWRL